MKTSVYTLITAVVLTCNLCFGQSVKLVYPMTATQESKVETAPKSTAKTKSSTSVSKVKPPVAEDEDSEDIETPIGKIRDISRKLDNILEALESIPKEIDSDPFDSSALIDDLLDALPKTPEPIPVDLTPVTSSITTSTETFETRLNALETSLTNLNTTMTTLVGAVEALQKSTQESVENTNVAKTDVIKAVDTKPVAPKSWSALICMVVAILVIVCANVATQSIANVVKLVRSFLANTQESNSNPWSR